MKELSFKTGTGAQIPVINPATEEVFAEVPNCSQENLNKTVEAALSAFASWKNVPVDARRVALKKCADVMLAHVEELAKILTNEQGKTLQASRDEIKLCAKWIESIATLEIKPQVLSEDSEFQAISTPVPLGVVGAITPWNFPLAMAVWKIAPALLAGNTMILKPSPFTPMSSVKLGELLGKVLPPGVFNVVCGDDLLGPRLVSHPKTAKIAFTGSINTGKAIFRNSADSLKRLSLELGGNDAAIVCNDVDVNLIGEKIFWSSFRNCGQICVAIKRLYVHEDIYPKLLKDLTERAQQIKVGEGWLPDIQQGPVNNINQLNRAIELVEDAVKRGAKIPVGGKRLARKGYFFPPTLVTEVREGFRIVDEEQFAPVLPIMPFRDLAEVIGRANATQFGLGASVWSANVDKAREIAAQLEAGTVWINQHGKTSPFWHLSGVKDSGIGYENGALGLSGYFQHKVVALAK